MIKRHCATTYVLVVVALIAVVGHICALPGHSHAATAGSDHPPTAPITDHEHSDGDAVHAASCEAVRSAAVNVETPTVAATSLSTSVIECSIETLPRVVAWRPPTASPPLYLTHRTLLI
jgi:hypothetical protein